ncbi:MAG TPA: diacylglycerol kinase family protein [Thermoanaerobaculia bacterium]|nr:diacylglycerol kinase family protein [Thermoanaerobaculia bacterium]
MSRHAVLIYNPYAGTLLRKPEAFRSAMNILARSGMEVSPAPTTGPRTAAAIAREWMDKGVDLVIACGGDGTINEVAEALVGTATPLGILPGGTANVMALELGLGLKLDEAAEKLSRAVETRIAVARLTTGEVAPRYFLLMAGAGVDAQVIYHLSQPLKDRWGKFAYWIAASRQLGRSLAELDVTIDGETRRCSFALASRIRKYGGPIVVAPGAHLLHDHFEVVLFEGASTFRYLRYLLGVARGTLDGTAGVTIRRAQSVHLSCPDDVRVRLQLDGDYAGKLPATIEIVPDALTLLVPDSFRLET